MSDAFKGGLFVAAAVATGLVAGLLVPSLVGAERDPGKRQRPHASLPAMPNVVGQQLDAAERVLERRRISFDSDAPGIVEDVVPEVLEVCRTNPVGGSPVRNGARLHVAVAGTCDL